MELLIWPKYRLRRNTEENQIGSGSRTCQYFNIEKKGGTYQLSKDAQKYSKIDEVSWKHTYANWFRWESERPIRNGMQLKKHRMHLTTGLNNIELPHLAILLLLFWWWWLLLLLFMCEFTRAIPILIIVSPFTKTFAFVMSFFPFHIPSTHHSHLAFFFLLRNVGHQRITMYFRQNELFTSTKAGERERWGLAFVGRSRLLLSQCVPIPPKHWISIFAHIFMSFISPKHRSLNWVWECVVEHDAPRIETDFSSQFIKQTWREKNASALFCNFHW